MSKSPKSLPDANYKKWLVSLPTDGPPQDASWSAEVDGAFAGLGVHPLPQKPQIFHLLPHEATRQTDLLATDHDLIGKPNSSIKKSMVSTATTDKKKPKEHHQDPGMGRGAHTTFWPLRSSLARMEAKRPSMWWRASTTTTLAQRPEPDTMVAGDGAATARAANAMELRTAKGLRSSVSRPLQPPKP